MLAALPYATPWLRMLSLVVAGFFITATVGYVLVEWRRAPRRPPAGEGQLPATTRDGRAA